MTSFDRLGARILVLAALAAGIAFAPAARAAQGPGCPDPEHCLPQNQLRYYELLRDSILKHWHPPSSVAADSVCTLDLRQSPGGQVTGVQTVAPCDLDETGRSSLLSAVREAQPLPYQGYEQVFKRQLRLSLHAQERDEGDENRAKRWWRRLKER
ncbi:MAG: hypothetical protein ACREP7_05135 [Lysobacter sp.]